MTSYERAEVADIDLASGLQLHHPRFLEYVGAPESARLLTRAPGHWVQTMDREEAVTAALQLQHDVGLITSNLQVLGQFVTSLNRMSSEVMRLVFGKEVFPSDAVQANSPAPRIHRAAHYMAAMGLWQPLGGLGAPGLLPVSSCNNFFQFNSIYFMNKNMYKSSNELVHGLLPGTYKLDIAKGPWNICISIHCILLTVILSC